MKSTLFFLFWLISLKGFASNADFKVSSCKEVDIGIETLMIPIEKNFKNFYSGDVQIYNVDVGEPAAKSHGLAIVMPFTEGQGPGVSCTAVTFFSGIDIRKAKSTFDSKGLLLTIPYSVYDHDSGVTKPSTSSVKIRVNRAKGTVTLETQNSM
ncbi:MAG: hypothetical protein SGJ18_08575 [Pseudomonadota bacterium]|nr:hypothetical protein [Pseudomonadota bacterium]